MAIETKVLLAALLTFSSALLSLAVVAAILVRLPADYFTARRRRVPPPPRQAALKVLIILGKNSLGLVLVAAGLVLALPGVPGQGLLTMFLGVLLLDFPGKYRLERFALRRRSILRAANRLRRKFGKEKFEIDPHIRGSSKKRTKFTPPDRNAP